MVDKTQLNTLKKQMEDLRKQATDEAREIFLKGAKDIFEKNPELESFGWPQYTPYWCDGDICTFSTCFDYSLSLTVGGEEYSEDEGDEGVPESTRDEIISFLKTFEDDDYLHMFGDHNQITVKRNGDIETEDYEHE